MLTSIDRVKAGIRLKTGSTSKDAEITAAIAAATNIIVNRCGRTFELNPPVGSQTFMTTVRSFQPIDGRILIVDDFESHFGGWRITSQNPNLTLTGKQDPLTWHMGEYVRVMVSPTHSQVMVTGEQIDIGVALEIVDPDLHWDFATNGLGEVSVSSIYGWPSIPPAIEQAATMVAARLFNRANSSKASLGFVAATDGALSYVSNRLDADVEALLSGYLRLDTHF